MTTHRIRALALRVAGCALLLFACGDEGDPAADGGGEEDPAANVGNACVPQQVPPGGFDEQEAYLEHPSDDCGEQPCLVYRVGGDPRPDCVPGGDVPCAPAEDVQEHVHCTCRCESPAGQGDCICPDGFLCVPVLEQGDPDLVGSYCVRNR